MIRCLPPLSSGALISAFSYRAAEGAMSEFYHRYKLNGTTVDNYFIFNFFKDVPRAPEPYTLAGFSCLSARAYLAAATIFMDLVIFWMFLMDFRRMVTGKREND